MNENNAYLIQQLAMNNPPHAATSVQEKVDRSRRLIGLMITNLKVTKAQVGHIQPEIGDANL